eukprot:33165-Eustigmatos_ZCMA.PRE.1
MAVLDELPVRFALVEVRGHVGQHVERALWGGALDPRDVLQRRHHLIALLFHLGDARRHHLVGQTQRHDACGSNGRQLRHTVTDMQAWIRKDISRLRHSTSW